MYLFSRLEIFDSSDRRPSDDDSSRRYVGAGGGAGLQRENNFVVRCPYEDKTKSGRASSLFFEGCAAFGFGVGAAGDPGLTHEP